MKEIDTLKITALGGGEGIGASCYLLQVAGKNILLDVGVKMRGGAFSYPGFHLLPSLGMNGGLTDVDAVLVSHAHLDHLGALPVVVRENPGVLVLTSVATAELLYPMLGQLAGRVSAEGLYFDRADIARLVGMVLPIEEVSGWARPFPLFYDGSVLVTVYPAGHLAGAACFYLQTSAGNVLYTGDFCLHHQWTAQGMALPPGLSVDLLIMESTYGNRPPSGIEDNLEENCGTGFYRKVWPVVVDVMERGGKVLLPSFALGRAQEVLCGLKHSMTTDNKNFPVCIDGLAREISKIYEGSAFRRHWGKDTWELLSNNLLLAGGGLIDVPPGCDGAKELLSAGPVCVVASSGQILQKTASARYAEHLLGDRDSCIILTGFQIPGTPGEALCQGMPSINLDGRQVEVRCQVKSFAMSGHAQVPELLMLIRQLSPRRVMLVHGEPVWSGGSFLEKVLLVEGIPVGRLRDGETVASDAHSAWQ